MALAEYTKVECTKSLLAGWCCDSAFRYRLVWESFLYVACPKEPSGLLYMSIFRKGRWLF